MPALSGWRIAAPPPLPLPGQATSGPTHGWNGWLRREGVPARPADFALLRTMSLHRSFARRMRAVRSRRWFLEPGRRDGGW
jgi:hypothetical protein